MFAAFMLGVPMFAVVVELCRHAYWRQALRQSGPRVHQADPGCFFHDGSIWGRLYVSPFHTSIPISMSKLTDVFLLLADDDHLSAALFW